MKTMFKDINNPKGGYNRVAPCGCSLYIDPHYQISSRQYDPCDIPDCPIREKIYELRDEDEGKGYLADYARWIFDHPETEVKKKIKEEMKDSLIMVNR